MKMFRPALSGILLGFLVLSSTCMQAQQSRPDKCGTMPLLEAAFKKDPLLKARFEKQELELQQLIAERNNNPALRPEASLTVPVVFHIVLPNPSVVTDAQVQAQLDTLNKDYAGLNGDSVKIPSYFKSLFGHAGIQFCLARRTPDNKPTTGIVRYTTTQSSFSTNDGVKHASTGGADAWNTSNYLNVWLCPLSGGLLGYSTFPNSGSASLQGVVIEYRSLPGGAYTTYNQGKTMTHEIGHYFNLYHVWGDDNGACTGTDYVGDTPNQADATYGAHTGVLTDACSTTSPGIMYQNYMDYSDDGSMEMFTLQQVTRMLAAASAYRSSLFSSNGCTPLALPNYDAATEAINTPAARLCSSGFTPIVTIANKGAATLTSLSISTQLDENAAVTTSWSGSVAALDSFVFTLPAMSVSTGPHTLTIYTSRPNGNTDQQTGNDTLRMTVTWYDLFTPPITEGFEGLAYPPTGWDIVNEDGAITWEKTTAAASTGSNAIVIRNYDDANTGTHDYLRLPQVIISNADSAYLTFRVAAGIAAASGAAFVWDTLEVLASTDCGATYSSLYKKWGASLSTTNRSFTGAYTPVNGEWRKDSVNLTGYIGQGQLLLAFRNTNEGVNNTWLDDINLYKKIINPNLKRKGFLITPSPTTGLVNVDFYPNPDNLQGIAIYSYSGQLVAQTMVSRGVSSNHYSFNLDRYAAGIYVVKLVFADRVVTQKLLKTN